MLTDIKIFLWANSIQSPLGVPLRPSFPPLNHHSPSAAASHAIHIDSNHQTLTFSQFLIFVHTPNTDSASHHWPKQPNATTFLQKKKTKNSNLRLSLSEQHTEVNSRCPKLSKITVFTSELTRKSNHSDKTPTTNPATTNLRRGLYGERVKLWARSWESVEIKGGVAGKSDAEESKTAFYGTSRHKIDWSELK